MTTTRPTEIKPIIRELVRTGLCFPNVVLLVDKIVIAQTAASVPSRARSPPETRTTPDSKAARPSLKQTQQRCAYRLYLTDGDKSIQGLPKRSLHGPILNGIVREGSIIVLRDYKLARGKRVNDGSANYKEQTTGDVIYLSIGDLFALGHDGREVHDGSREDVTRGTNQSEETDTVNTRSEDTVSVRFSASRNNGSENETLEEDDMIQAARPSTESKQEHGPFRAKATPEEVRNNASPEIAHPMIALEPCSPQRSNRCSSDGSTQTRVPSDTHAPLQSALFPACLITPLAEITSPSTPRHTLASVLAQITHVSAHTFKPASLPLRKRDLRIRDSSTRKRVLLSVFVDADAFQPAVGTVALFRGVRSHEWGGGNLKKWPRDYVGGWAKAGKESTAATAAVEPTAESWYVPEPAGKVEGISVETVEHIRSSVSKWAQEEEEERVKWQSGQLVKGPNTKRRRLK